MDTKRITGIELRNRIERHRAYLKAREVGRKCNPHVKRVHSYNDALYIVYHEINGPAWYVRSIGSVYRAKSEKGCKQIIEHIEKRDALLHAAMVNDQ